LLGAARQNLKQVHKAAGEIDLAGGFALSV
jgi:hypothetical protein